MTGYQTCEICGSPASSYHRVNEIDLFRCANCNFIFSDRNKEIDFDYQTELYVDVAEKSKRIHQFYADARLRFITKHKKNIDSLLDVGCSSGIFLEKVNHGIKNLKGIDLSPKAIMQAKRKGLYVELKSVFDENGQYDAITFIEVVEHFKDLNLLFNKLNSLLNKNGIVYFQTGNTTSLQFLLKGKKWHYFDPPSHCSYLGKKSIAILMRNHNFKVLDINAGIDPWSFLLTKNKPYHSIQVLKGLIGKIHLGGYTIPASVGVIAQKIS